MRRDVRRFVYFRFRLLECPRRVPVNLSAVWLDMFGFIPPFLNGAVAGSHFLVDGGRAVVVARPQRVQVSESVRAQLFAVVGAKHAVEGVWLARSGEAPDLRPPDRITTAADLALVEEWPVSEERDDEPLVAEHVNGPGVWLADRADGWHATSQIEEALVFNSHAEVEDRLLVGAPTPPMVIRYLAAARAEADQRAAALIDVRNDFSR